MLVVPGNHISEYAMLHRTLLVLAVASTATAAHAEGKPAHWHRPAVILPAGLPRPHYNFRTTISYGPAPAHRPPYGPRVNPIDEGDRGLYDGGPYVPYWDRLPYACGVYGYC